MLTYYGHMDENNYLQQELFEQEKYISDLIEKNSHVLDVGCGDGILMDYLI